MANFHLDNQAVWFLIPISQMEKQSREAQWVSFAGTNITRKSSRLVAFLCKDVLSR